MHVSTVRVSERSGTKSVTGNETLNQQLRDTHMCCVSIMLTGQHSPKRREDRSFIRKVLVWSLAPQSSLLKQPLSTHWTPNYRHRLVCCNNAGCEYADLIRSTSLQQETRLFECCDILRCSGAAVGGHTVVTLWSHCGTEGWTWSAFKQCSVCTNSSKVCRENIPRYSTSTRHHWQEAGWIHTFMVFTSKSDLTVRMMFCCNNTLLHAWVVTCGYLDLCCLPVSSQQSGDSSLTSGINKEFSLRLTGYRFLF